MKILLAGDYYPSSRIREMMNNNNFSYFKEITHLTENHDLSIVNLETPIVERDILPIEKCGVNLYTSSKVIDSLMFAGFEMVTLANNHIMDYGKEGLINTITLLKKAGIKYVGVGENLMQADRIEYFEKNRKKLAIINCCETEFSIAKDNKAGANPLNPIRQFYSIKKAKEKADYVLVIVHGGPEHFQLPSPRMVETYRFFIEAGADAVINHHQHCFSGFEIYKEKPIFYGIGNLCFDSSQKEPSTFYEGYMVSLSFDDSMTFEIIPYIQCKEKPLVEIKENNYYVNKIEELNQIIQNSKILDKKIKDYYNKFNSTFTRLFEPYNNKLVRFLYRKKLLPNPMKKDKLRLIRAYIQCESQSEKLLDYLIRNS